VKHFSFLRNYSFNELSTDHGIRLSDFWSLFIIHCPIANQVGPHFNSWSLHDWRPIIQQTTPVCQAELKKAALQNLLDDWVMTECNRRLMSMVLSMVLLMVLSMVVLMVVKWVSHCTVLGDKLGCTELTKGTELGALEGGFDGLIEGRNIKSNMPFSCLKQSIGSSEGTVDVSMAWNWTSHWVNVIRDTLGSAANHRGYSLDLWRVAFMVCLAATYHWTRYFAKHAAWLLEVC